MSTRCPVASSGKFSCRLSQLHWLAPPHAAFLSLHTLCSSLFAREWTVSEVEESQRIRGPTLSRDIEKRICDKVCNSGRV